MKMLFFMYMLGCSVNCYLFFHYVLYSKGSKLTKTLITLFLLVVAGVPPLLSAYFEGAVPGVETFYDWMSSGYLFGINGFSIYSAGLYFCYIGCFFLAIITATFDIIQLFFLVVFKLRFNGRQRRRLRRVFIVVTLCINVSALYQGIKIPEVEEVTISSSKIKEELTLVVLADLHITRHSSKERLAKIVQKANALNPDIVILDGDIIDDYIDMVEKKSGASFELKNLKSKYGMYFVMGNHEYLYDRNGDIVEAIKSYGARVFINEGDHVAGVYFGGICDITNFKRHVRKHLSKATPDLIPDVDTAMAGALPDDYKILLSHTPAQIGENDINLVISGHTHGGQLFPLHLIIKYSNHGYIGGLYNVDEDKNVYVSEGTAQWGPAMRLLSHTEISKIVLKPKN